MQIKATAGRTVRLQDVILQSRINGYLKQSESFHLLRPATIGDGVHLLNKAENTRRTARFNQAMAAGRVMKFVDAVESPRSLMAPLVQLCNRYDRFDMHDLERDMQSGEEDAAVVLNFFKRLRAFAFTADLETALMQLGEQLPALLAMGEHRQVLDILLNSPGLNYAALPVALMKFHQYEYDCRTPLEEHLVESTVYAQDAGQISRIHYVVNERHSKAVEKHLERAVEYYESFGVNFAVSLGKTRTDDVAVLVDERGNPLESDGSWITCENPNETLLRELQQSDGDIVFVQSIDNVVHDSYKGDGFLQRKILAGYLLELQELLFQYMDRLVHDVVDDDYLQKAAAFARDNLNISVPDELLGNAGEQLRHFLIGRLNRPIRVCAVTANTGEVDVAPYWVDNGFELSLQLVDCTEKYAGESARKGIRQDAADLAVVEMVCGLRDFEGQTFHLSEWQDTQRLCLHPDHGHPVAAGQLAGPGFRSGAMAGWITILIRVPESMLAAVKGISQLLDKEHQTFADNNFIENIFDVSY